MSFRAPFYFKLLSRERAEEILLGKETGSFLLRKSKQPNSYALSIAYQNAVIHYRINWNAQTGLYNLQNDSGSPFSSLDELCQFHTENKGIMKSKLLHPLTSSKPNKGNFYVPPIKSKAPVNDNKPQPIPKNFHPHKLNNPVPDNSPLENSTLRPQQVTHRSQVDTAASQAHNNNYLPPNEINSPSPSQIKEFNLNTSEGERYTGFDHHSLPSNFYAHQECDWFHGPIDSNESFARLSKMYKKHKLDGIFLVRLKTASRFVLEMTGNGKTCKYDIQQEHSTKLFKISDEMQKFYTLKELIDFLRVNSTDVTGLQCSLKLPCQVINKSKGIKSFFRGSKSTLTTGTEVQNFQSTNIPRKALELGKVLGSGNFGDVKEGILKTGSTKINCAVKILKSANKKHSDAEMKKNRAELENERDIMVGLDHPNIVRLLGMCNDGSNVLLVLELVPRGSLKKYLDSQRANRFSTAEQVTLMLNICNGMKYLSERNIIHRDLAARNILLDSNNAPKIADFGMARLRPEGVYVQFDIKKGPIRWYAPECLVNSIYNSKSDVWSFGVTMWEIATCGQVPYEGVNHLALPTYLGVGNRLRKPELCPIEIFRIMTRCWEMEPDKRPDFINLYILLQNPY